MHLISIDVYFLLRSNVLLKAGEQLRAESEIDRNIQIVTFVGKLGQNYRTPNLKKMSRIFLITLFFVPYLTGYGMVNFDFPFMDTIPLKPEIENQDDELAQLRKKYAKYYHAQKQPDTNEEDYLWSGKPINHEDLGITIEEEGDDFLTLEQIQILEWKKEGISEEEIADRLTLKNLMEEDLRQQVRYSFQPENPAPNLDIREEKSDWQGYLTQELTENVETSERATPSNIELYSFTAADGLPGIPPTFSDLKHLPNREEPVIRLTQISFNPQTDIFKAKAKAELLQLVDVLKSEGGGNFEIAVHTNGWMDKSVGKELSNRRAKRIDSFLKENGIKNTRYQVRGYGSEEPIADNLKMEGRRLNQRVEIRWMVK